MIISRQVFQPYCPALKSSQLLHFNMIDSSKKGQGIQTGRIIKCFSLSNMFSLVNKEYAVIKKQRYGGEIFKVEIWISIIKFKRRLKGNSIGVTRLFHPVS